MTNKIGYLQTDARCPYCHKELKRIPKRKTKCPHCENVFYVRSKVCHVRGRQISNDKYIVTSENASKLEWEWAEFRQNRDISALESAIDNLPEESKDFEKKLYLARIEMARENYDEAWELFNNARHEALSVGDLSFYKDITFFMAEHQYLMENYKQAIYYYCEYLYYCMGELDSIESEIDNSSHRAAYSFSDNLYNTDNYSRYKDAINNIRAIIYEINLKQEIFNDIALEACEQAFSELKGSFKPTDALPCFVNLAYGVGELEDL